MYIPVFLNSILHALPRAVELLWKPGPVGIDD